MVFKLLCYYNNVIKFENDVKMYGIQTPSGNITKTSSFENDVKMYGIQTRKLEAGKDYLFENDVKMYGIQTRRLHRQWKQRFENDVKCMVFKRNARPLSRLPCLRMM